MRTLKDFGQKVKLHVFRKSKPQANLATHIPCRPSACRGDFQAKDDHFCGKYSVDVSQRLSDIIWVSIAPSPTPSPEKFGSHSWASSSNFQESSQNWARHEPSALPLTNLALSKRHSDIVKAHHGAFRHLGPAPRSTDRIFDGISHLQFSDESFSSTSLKLLRLRHRCR